MLALPGNVVLLNTEGGTYRSADGGRRWGPLEGVLSSGYVRGFASQGPGGRGVLAATDNGLFRSSDGGAIWSAYGTGLPANSGLVALLTHKDQPDFIAAAVRTSDGAMPPDLLLTRDGGRIWLPVDLGGGWSHATAWAVDPGNADSLYLAGADYVAASKDGGLSWTIRQAALADVTARTAIAVAPSDGSTVYVGGATGLRSKDGGRTWTELGGYDETADALAVDPGAASHVWSGGADGVRESRDGGNTWQRAGLDGQGIGWLAAAPGTNGEAVLYAGLVDGGIMRRQAAGGDWQPADSGLPAGSVIIAFAADPRTPGLLWAARDGGRRLPERGRRRHLGERRGWAWATISG